MKKGGHALLITFFCLLCLVLGIFLGRNLNDERVVLLQNIDEDSVLAEETDDRHLLNINTATKPQLQELPGIGDIIAQRIIDYREVNGPFQTVDELKNVEGIGDKKLYAIIDLVEVGG